MKKQNTDIENIQNPLLVEALKGNPFLVPEDYFSSLQKEVQVKKHLTQLGESSFLIPEQYQKALRQDILTKISEQKLSAKVPSFSPPLPQGYFDDLKQRILNKTIENNDDIRSIGTNDPKIEPAAKTIKTFGISKWIPYAVAASITIVMGLFLILDEGKSTQNEQIVGNFSTIDAIPTEEIINYLAAHTEQSDLEHLSEQLNDRTVEIVDDLTNQEIEAYLEYSL